MALRTLSTSLIFAKHLNAMCNSHYSSFRKMALADLTLIKAYGKREISFVRQIWLAPKLVFPTIPPLFDNQL